MDKSCFIYNFNINKNGSAQKIEIKDNLDFENSKDSYSWFHMCALHSTTRDFLKNHSDLEPIIIDAMLAEETRPRALIKDNGMLVILRAMNLNQGEDPSDMISIRMWIDNKCVITTRRRDIKAIDDIIDHIKHNEAPKSPGDFLIMITDRLFERMEPFFTDLADQISKSEELLARGDPEKITDDAVLGRRCTAIYTRYITPQKIVLNKILAANFKWLEAEHKEHLVESLDRVVRYIEELQELRDRSQILNDGLDSLHSRRLNDITYIFSVAATIFLPLGFLTGLMGINIGGMPGIDNDYAFALFSTICILIIVVQIIVFRKLKWF